MIKEKILKEFNAHEGLLKYATIVFSASMIANAINYLFQLYIGRSLGPIGYGIFGALMSLFYIISAPVQTIQTVLTNFIAELNGKKEYGKMRYLLVYSFKITFIAGFLLFLVFFIFRHQIKDYLQIPSQSPVILIGIVLWLALLIPVFMGVINGLQKFKLMGFSGVVSSGVKLIAGVLLVSAGYWVNGAIGSLIVSGLLVILVISLPLRDIFKHKSETTDTKNIFKYSLPVLYSLTLLTFLTNIDVILVKHYFEPLLAGYYTAAALLAKVVFFASGSLAVVMFPKLADMHKKNEDIGPVLKNTLKYVFMVSFFIIVVYFTAPNFVVSMLFGSKYKIADLIGMFGIALAFFSFSNILIMYKMAIKEFDFIPFLTFCFITEVGAILLFHNSLVEVIKILIIVNALLLNGLIGYVRRWPF